MSANSIGVEFVLLIFDGGVVFIRRFDSRQMGKWSGRIDKEMDVWIQDWWVGEVAALIKKMDESWVVR